MNGMTFRQTQDPAGSTTATQVTMLLALTLARSAIALTTDQFGVANYHTEVSIVTSSRAVAQMKRRASLQVQLQDDGAGEEVEKLEKLRLEGQVRNSPTLSRIQVIKPPKLTAMQGPPLPTQHPSSALPTCVQRSPLHPPASVASTFLSKS